MIIHVNVVCCFAVRVIQDKPGYFAKKIQKSMKGLGTEDSALIRVVVSRCECDMVQIMQSFEQQFNAPLAQWIRVNTICPPFSLNEPFTIL